MAVKYQGAFEPRCPHCDRYFLRKTGHAEGCPRRPRLERCTTCRQAWDNHLARCPAGLILAGGRMRMDVEARGHEPDAQLGLVRF